MLIEANIDRLDLTENIPAMSEQWLAIGATPAQNLSLVENEIEMLAHYQAEDPERVQAMIAKLEVIAQQLRQQIAQ